MSYGESSMVPEPITPFGSGIPTSPDISSSFSYTVGGGPSYTPTTTDFSLPSTTFCLEASFPILMFSGTLGVLASLYSLEISLYFTFFLFLVTTISLGSPIVTSSPKYFFFSLCVNSLSFSSL